MDSEHLADINDAIRLASAQGRGRRKLWKPIADSGYAIFIVNTEVFGYETALVNGDETRILAHHTRLRDAVFDTGIRAGIMLASGTLPHL